MNRGIAFWTPKEGGAKQIFLIGNPAVWYSAAFGVVAFGVLFAFYLLLQQRHIALDYFCEFFYKEWKSV